MSKKVILAKYQVYYSTKQLPDVLLQYTFRDQNILILKDGLAEINGFKCFRFVMQVFRKNNIADRQRIIEIEGILKSLIESHSIEYFIRG